MITIIINLLAATYNTKMRAIYPLIAEKKRWLPINNISHKNIDTFTNKQGLGVQPYG